ncbi:MAG: hypothetical protein QXR92_05285 [Fervidicoccaceae archaeon]
MRATATLNEIRLSRLKAGESDILIVYSVESKEFTATAIERNGMVDLDLECPCSQKKEELINHLSEAAIEVGRISIKAGYNGGEECLSCTVAAILTSAYALAKTINVMEDIEASQEMRAILASSLLGGINIYSFGSRTPALLRYFYPSEFIKAITIQSQQYRKNMVVSRDTIFSIIEGLSLIYAGENEQGTKILLKASNSFYSGSELPIIPLTTGDIILLPSSTSCSSFLMSLGSKIADYLKDRGNMARISRLGRGATVLID